jgi:hypothetical protein
VPGCDSGSAVTREGEGYERTLNCKDSLLRWRDKVSGFTAECASVCVSGLENQQGNGEARRGREKGKTSRRTRSERDPYWSGAAMNGNGSTEWTA